MILVTLGSAAGLVRSVVRQLRDQGVRAGMLRIRYLRPMPSALIAEALRGAKAVGVLEKDVSFGAEGTVFTNVNSALQQAAVGVPTYDFVGGLGGDDISEAQVRGMYAMLAQAAEGADDLPRVSFLGIDSPADCHPERSEMCIRDRSCTLATWCARGKSWATSASVSWTPSRRTS